VLDLRVAELADYQSLAYAREYAETVRLVRDAERERTPGREELTAAVARNLHKLMAYKDEYEVARLHLHTFEQARLRAEFGEEAKVWINLHPPLLRALGLKRKLKLGRWFTPALRALRGLRRLRGTPLDVFGYAKMRRTERALVGEYRELVDVALARLTPETHDAAVELCELPDVIRGYEEIKLRNVALFHGRAKALRKRLEHGGVAPQVELLELTQQS
jgi:indolepyruvate ferredoxin oxidoreductase